MRERVHDEAVIDRLQAAGEGVRRLGSGVELGLGLGLAGLDLGLGLGIGLGLGLGLGLGVGLGLGLGLGLQGPVKAVELLWWRLDEPLLSPACLLTAEGPADVRAQVPGEGESER